MKYYKFAVFTLLLSCVAKAQNYPTGRTVIFGSAPEIQANTSTVISWTDAGVVNAQSTEQIATYANGVDGVTLKLELTGSDKIRTDYGLGIQGFGSSLINSASEWLEFRVLLEGTNAANVANLKLVAVKLKNYETNENIEVTGATKTDLSVSQSNIFTFPSSAPASERDTNDNLLFNHEVFNNIARLSKHNRATIAHPVAGADLDKFFVRLGIPANDTVGTTYRIESIRLAYEFHEDLSNIKVGDRLGAASVGGKYYHDTTTSNYSHLKEGADSISTMGSSVMKVFMSVNYANAIYWMDWTTSPASSLKDLAKTFHYKDLFLHNDIDTYIIDAKGFTAASGGTVEWKDGMTSTEIQTLYDEVYDFVYYMCTRWGHRNKTFILQNWEGDNMWNLGNNPSEGEVTPGLPIEEQEAIAQDGMVAFFNTRQEAIDAAKAAAYAAVSYQVTFWGAAECDDIRRPVLDGSDTTVGNWNQADRDHYILETVFPRLKMDLYSISNYQTLKADRMHDINEMLDVVKAYCPDSSAFGYRNIYMGEFGAKENVIAKNKPRSQRQVISMLTASSQARGALTWGARYAIFWAIYDTGFIDNPATGQDYTLLDLDGGTFVPAVPRNLTSTGRSELMDILKGNWLIRPDYDPQQPNPDLSLVAPIYREYERIMNLDLDDYEKEHQFEQNYPWTTYPAGYSSDLSISTIENDNASARAFDRLEAPTGGSSGELAYRFYITEDGNYQISLRTKQDQNCAIYKVFVNGVELAQIDDYSSSEVWFDHNIGSSILNEGFNIVSIEVVGANSNNVSNDNYVNLDAISLTSL